MRKDDNILTQAFSVFFSSLFNFPLTLVNLTFNSAALLTITAFFLADIFPAISPQNTLLFINKISNSAGDLITNFLNPLGQTPLVALSDL